MTEKIVNLTQHFATIEQEMAGVTEPNPQVKEKLKELLTFQSLPTREEIEERADQIAQIAIEARAKRAMIDGALYLMTPLERALKKQGIVPLYAFSERVSVEKEVEGKTIKTQVFKHLGFVEAAGK